MNMKFTPRTELAEFEWGDRTGQWRRPEIDSETLKRLTERSTWNGVWRVGLFVALLGSMAALTLWVGRYSLLLAVPFMYAYWTLYGFWVAIGHELQHKMVFARSAKRYSEVLYFIVQFFMWNSPRYARISHQLHHRYTMVRGKDPETDWPEIITTRWLRRYLGGLILKMLVVGSPVALWQDVMIQLRRVAGHKDRMMREFCSENDNRAIRIESAVYLSIHVAIVASAIVFRRWEPILFITIAWQIGFAIENLWHQTEHIGRAYNVNDQRLCTRSVRVGLFVHMLYWGLDDHVDHHLFPSVPSRNLPKLHQVLKSELAEPQSMIQCWKEMFAIAREKDSHPDHEYIPCAL